MNIDEVYEWIQKDVEIDEEQAIKLKTLQVDGYTLLSATREDLKNEFKLLSGPAVKITATLNKIKNNGISLYLYYIIFLFF